MGGINPAAGGIDANEGIVVNDVYAVAAGRQFVFVQLVFLLLWETADKGTKIGILVYAVNQLVIEEQAQKRFFLHAVPKHRKGEIGIGILYRLIGSVRHTAVFRQYHIRIILSVYYDTAIGRFSVKGS